jgi:hypothetical protein
VDAHASYVDPTFDAKGSDALDAMVAGVHEQFPGHRFRKTGTVDVHNDRAMGLGACRARR